MVTKMCSNEENLNEKKDILMIKELIWFNEQSKENKDFKSIRNEKYWSIIESLFSLRCQLAEDRCELRKALVLPTTTTLSASNTYNTVEYYNDLELLEEEAQVNLDNLLDNYFVNDTEIYHSKKEVPRIIRLSQKLKLSRAETYALQFVILHHVGQEYFPPITSSSIKTSYWERGMLRNMRICVPTLQNPLEFLSPRRLHVQQNIIKLNDDPIALDLANISFSMDKCVLSCIMGVELDVDELLAIDGTILANVLEEEEELQVKEEEDLNKGIVEKEAEVSEEEVKMEERKDRKAEDLYQTIEQLLFEETKLNQEIESSKSNLIEQEETNIASASAAELLPYEDDLDYLNEYFTLIAARLEHLSIDLEDESSFRMESKSKTQLLREKSNKIKTSLLKTQRRLELTTSFTPRLEKLITMRHLKPFEKLVILTLIGIILSADIHKIMQQYHLYQFTVGHLLRLHFSSLRDQIEHRSTFYKNSTLIKERIIFVEEKNASTSDLYNCRVDLDRRVLDYCLKLDTELNCLVDGTILLDPSIHIDSVVLPSYTKKIVLQTLENACYYHDNKASTSASTIQNTTILLLHGKSGVGKTMFASAIANHLQKKLLCATLLSSAETLVDDLRLIFREARIQRNAIVFLDECEGLFEARTVRGQYTVNKILAELEKFKESLILILATNRPNDLDEALFRRITLSVELPLPDAVLREEIWRSHFEQLSLHPDSNKTTCLDFKTLAINYELSGGFIKNAILYALLNVQNDASQLTQDHLQEACLVQIRSQFELDYSSHQCTLPHDLQHDSLENLICLQENSASKDILQRAMAEYKFHHLLKLPESSSSLASCLSILVLGPCQSGKTKTIKAMAHECNRPIVTISLLDLVQRHARYSKESTSYFRDLFLSGAMLHLELHYDFDNLEMTSMHFLYQMLQNFKGFIAIELTCSLSQLQYWMRNQNDSTSYFAQLVHRVSYVVRLDGSSSSNLWKSCLANDKQLQQHHNIDCVAIQKLYPNFTIGQIQRIIHQAKIELLFKQQKKQYTKSTDFVLSTDDIIQSIQLFKMKYTMAGASHNYNVMYA